jgi:HEPN domain-containing protein
MSATKKEAGRWLRQAENELSAARLLAKRGFAAQACFMAHQAAEKALKAVAGFDGQDDLTGHSISDLVSSLQPRHPQLAEHAGSAGHLDRYYTWTRYPSDRTDAAPFEAYDRRQANEAADAAERIVRTTHAVLKPRRKWWSLPSALLRRLARR